MGPVTLCRIFVLSVLLSVACLVNGVSHVTVITTIGTIIGFEDEVLIEGASFPVTKFLGIPYAENTSGENRFEKPIAKAPFKTPYQATGFSASCFQISDKRINVSEDCLSLNIYLPKKLSEVHSVPVMIWIHGGAYLVGAGSLYKAEALSAFGNVIVVTINYRLEMFGFLRTNDGKLVGNQGLWDQQLAIQWVSKHIDSFGGNPDEVTIFGESAGSASVLLQSLYPVNKGLFKRVIAESGSPLSDWAVREPVGDKLIEAVGCSKEKDPILCLKQKNPYGLELEGNKLKYAPSVDGEFLVESPHDIIYGNNSVSEEARTFFASLNILTGINNFDGAIDLMDLWPFVLHEVFPDITVNRTQFLELVVPAVANGFKPNCELGKLELEEAIAFQYTNWEDPNNDTKIRDMVVSLSSDVTFFTGAIGIVQLHSQFQQGHTYMYEFALKPSTHALPTPSWIDGKLQKQLIACHFYPSLTLG